MEKYSWISKVFSYKGNANVNGTFVYCGFRPKYILIKVTSFAGASWGLHDVKRNPYNPVDLYLIADGANTDINTTNMDILSNGFKIKTALGQWNAIGENYVGIAYAEMPGKYSNAR